MSVIRTYKKKTYHLEQNTLIMGVLQVKPASFSADAPYYDTEQAAEEALHLAEQGADLIDLTTVGGHEQSLEFLSVIRSVCCATEVPVVINIDNNVFVEQALKAGAAIIRDNWGGRKGREVIKLAASNNVPIILTHNRREPVYKDLIGEIKADLMISAALAVASGVREDNIILDPGLGSGKTKAQSLQVIKYLHEYSTLGYPLLLDAAVPAAGTEECAAVVSFGISRGARIIRVHNVAAMSHVARMTDTILNPT